MNDSLNKPIEKNILPITFDKMHGMYWSKALNYKFAEKDIISELALAEIPTAAVNLPLAFVQSDNGQYHLVMLQGFQRGKNLLVSSDGKWLADYIPSLYRFFPFTLRNSSDNKLVLCFNNLYSQLTEDPNEEPFFDSNNQNHLSALVQNVFDNLIERWSGIRKSAGLVSQLNDADLIKPWHVSYLESSNEVKVQGLFCIDEKKLSEISTSTLISLRDSGALTLAYCQMLSMNKLDFLLRLSSMHNQEITDSVHKTSEEDLLFSSDNYGELNFDNL